MPNLLVKSYYLINRVSINANIYARISMFKVNRANDCTIIAQFELTNVYGPGLLYYNPKNIVLQVTHKRCKYM